MKVAAFALFSSAIADEVNGGTIALEFEDCGTPGVTHGSISDLQPTSFALGDDVTLTATGDLDADVAGGSFNIHLEAEGVFKKDWTGDVCEAKSFKLPLGLGSISWGGMSCPVPQGDLSVPIGLKMKSIVPAALANGKIAATGKVSDGSDFFCVNAQFHKQAEVDVTGGTIALEFEDCGTPGVTHGSISDLQPTSFALGDDVTLTATGDLDADVAGGSFNIHLEAEGVFKKDWTGDVCEAKSFKLPLGLGSISWGGMSCPVPQGDLSVPIGLKMKSIVPAALANGKIAATGKVSDGSDFFCVNAQFHKQAEVDVTGGTIALEFEDCGTPGVTHGSISDLQPTSFALGDDVTLTATGDLDADVAGGSFNIHLEAEGVFKKDWTGDVCEAKSFKLPLGLGSISWGGMSCPVPQGDLSVPIGLKMKSIVPAALANGKIAATGKVSDGSDFFCVNAQFHKQADVLV